MPASPPLTGRSCPRPTASIKILAEAQPLELRGEGELERILVHDLNEDEDYELTADAFVMLK